MKPSSAFARQGPETSSCSRSHQTRDKLTDGQVMPHGRPSLSQPGPCQAGWTMRWNRGGERHVSGTCMDAESINPLRTAPGP